MRSVKQLSYLKPLGGVFLERRPQNLYLKERSAKSLLELSNAAILVQVNYSCRKRVLALDLVLAGPAVKHAG